MPIGVTIASWAADGISYVATDKTLTEHGISAVVGQDCSIWRVFKGGEFCEEYFDKGYEVANLDTDPEGGDGEDIVAGDVIVASALTDIVVAEIEETVTAAVTEESPVAGKIALAPVVVAKIAAPVVQPVKAAAPARTDRYFVIGSYYGPTYAGRLAEKHAILGAWVKRAKVGERDVYRVVVGPFARGEQPAIRKIISRANIREAWVISAKGPGRRTGAQLASLLEAYMAEPGQVQLATLPR